MREFSFDSGAFPKRNLRIFGGPTIESRERVESVGRKAIGIDVEEFNDRRRGINENNAR